MNSIVEQCLESINATNTETFIGEMAICDAFIDAYEKTLQLLEYYRDDEKSSLECLKCDPIRIIVEAEQPVSATAQTQQQQTQQTATTGTATTAATGTTQQAATNDAKKDDKKDDDEKLWDFEFRHDKKDSNEKEHIIFSILAFPIRLIIAIGKFIYRWVKSLFSSKDKAKKNEQAIAQGVAGLTEEQMGILGPITTEWVAKQQAIINNTNINPFVCTINNHFTANVIDTANGKSQEVIVVYPPVNLEGVAQAYQKMELQITSQIKGLFIELRDGKVEGSAMSQKITNASNELIKIAQEWKTLVAKGRTVLEGQIKARKPVVTGTFTDGKTFNTNNNGIVTDAVYGVLENIQKIQQVVNNDVKEMEESYKRMQKQRGTVSNGTYVAINNVSNEELESLKKMMNLVKENIKYLQEYAGLGFAAINSTITWTTVIHDELAKNKDFLRNLINTQIDRSKMTAEQLQKLDNNSPTPNTGNNLNQNTGNVDLNQNDQNEVDKMIATGNVDSQNQKTKKQSFIGRVVGAAANKIVGKGKKYKVTTPDNPNGEEVYFANDAAKTQYILDNQDRGITLTEIKESAIDELDEYDTVITEQGRDYNQDDNITDVAY